MTSKLLILAAVAVLAGCASDVAVRDTQMARGACLRKEAETGTRLGRPQRCDDLPMQAAPAATGGNPQGQVAPKAADAPK